jgi:peptidoglycan/xylan/chitin deacetylase (PgdA/CDA1 family)
LKASVVIPTYNEEKFVENLIKSLLDQDYNGEYEIIFVDNNSTDGTLEIYPVKILIEEKTGVAHARQKGFTNAQGETILSTDADCVVPRDWIRRYVEEFEKDPEVISLNGSVYFKSQLVWRIEILIRGNYSFSGGNFAVRREYFYKVGGFRTDLGNRLKKLGKVKTINNPVITSSRRFREGFFKSVFLYILLNYFYLNIFKKPFLKSLKPIRKVGRFSPNPIFAFSIFLLAFLLFLYEALAYKIPKRDYIIFERERDVLITFDDGPGKYTLQILDTLDKYGVKAIFFLVGRNVEIHPDLVREIHRRGHIIGNHSYSHSPSMLLWGFDKVYKEIDSTNKLIERITGEKVIFFRPPYGRYSRAMDSVVRILGMKVILWNNDSEDWKNLPKPLLVSNILRQVKPGSIILLHERINTLKALGPLIDSLRGRGYMVKGWE